MLQVIHLPKTRLLVIFAAVVTTFALAGTSVVCAARATEAVAAVETSEPEVAPRPELPREWVWRKKPVRLDGMFRTM